MDAKHTDCTVLRLSVFVVFLLFPLHCSYAIYNITSSQALSQGQNLTSLSQIFELGFVRPNNSGNQYVGIWYKQTSPQTVIWVTNRDNHLAVTDSLASLIIDSNGNLNIVDGRKSSVWSTNIGVPSNSSAAVLLDNGNLLLKEGISGEVLWSSFDHPGNTLVPQSVICFNVKTGVRQVLTSWKSENEPSLGNFTVGISLQSPPQAFIWVNGSTPYWRTGPWDRIKFIGVPDMESSYISAIKLDEDKGMGANNFTFVPLLSKSSYYLFISSEGVLKVMQKDEDQDYWYINWEGPKSKCGVYGVCGPFAVSKASDSLVCNCLKGLYQNQMKSGAKETGKEGA